MMKKLGIVQTVDIETGKVVAEKKNAMNLLPPGDVCQVCAVDHPWDAPHNQQSLYFQYRFYSEHRWPTWSDAMAHCTPEVQAAWKSELVAKVEGPKTLKRYMPEDIFAAIFAACDVATRPVLPQCLPGDWWRALLGLLWQAPLRIRAALAVKWVDVRVETKKPQTQKSGVLLFLRLQRENCIVQYKCRAIKPDEATLALPGHERKTMSDFISASNLLPGHQVVAVRKFRSARSNGFGGNTGFLVVTLRDCKYQTCRVLESGIKTWVGVRSDSLEKVVESAEKSLEPGASFHTEWILG